MNDRMETIKLCVGGWLADHEYSMIYLDDYANTEEFIEAVGFELELWRGEDDWQDFLAPYTMNVEDLADVADWDIHTAITDLVKECPEAFMMWE